MAVKCSIGNKYVLGMSKGDKRIYGKAYGNELMYQEIYKLATGTEIEITDTKNDTGRIAGVEFASNQVVTTGKNLLSVPFSRTYSSTLRSNINNFQPGTYTFSFEMQTPGGNQVTARKIKDGITTQITLAYNAKTLTFTLDEVATLELEIYKVGIELNDISLTMLEEGSVATSYEPYTGGQPSPSPDYPSPVNNTGDGGILNITSSNGTVTDTYPITLPVGYVGGSLPNGVKDTYELIDGEWKFVQRVGKVVLNGSENWYKWGADTFYILKLSSTRIALSNYYKYNINITGASQLNNGEFFIHDSTNNNVVVFRNTSYTTVADFKTWLSTHNIIVYYVLETPIIHNAEDILINTYNNYNKIECTNAGEPVMTVKYLEK